MQDFQSIPGLAGRLFGGAAAADIRRAQGPASRCGVFSQAASAQPEAAVKCPRCESTNTKFCYYNNYSLSQPRYFCKGCRRYWTKGGSLRNVPVGGGCRKNRRGKPVRPLADTASENHGAAAFSHQFHGPVRPDLLLEGMVGNPAELGQPASADKPTEAAEGSTIDLAVLYSKFLSHQSHAEQRAVGPESADPSSGSSTEMSPPALSSPGQHGFGEICGAPSSTEPGETTMLECGDARAQALGELNFGVDQSCYDSLGLPADGGDLMLPSAWGQEAKYEPFNSLPEEDAMSLHEGVAGGYDVWSKVMGCQGLEAALSAGFDRC